jgi:uncharacterized protein (TIGR02117 family)
MINFLFISAFRFVLHFLHGFLAFAILYFLSSFWLPYCKVNQNFVAPQQGVVIYIESNGVHTDFLLPARSEEMDWFTCFPTTDFQDVDAGYDYLSIGWGDRGFYLYTPTWADLKFSTAFKAAFALDSAAMHVTYRLIAPQPDEGLKKLVISQEQYKKLIAYILAGFKKRNGTFWHIEGHTYGRQDTFYEAKGSYSLFKTCNVWTCEGLKAIGVKIGVWAPFEDGLMRQL